MCQNSYLDMKILITNDEADHDNRTENNLNKDSSEHKDNEHDHNNDDEKEDEHKNKNYTGLYNIIMIFNTYRLFGFYITFIPIEREFSLFMCRKIINTAEMVMCVGMI